MVDLTDLLTRLRSPDDATRHAACCEAQVVRDPDSTLVAALVERLSDPGEIQIPDPDIRLSDAVADRACETLSRWGDKARPAMPALLELLDGGAPFASARAASVLLKIDADALLPRVLAHLERHPQASSIVRDVGRALRPRDPTHAPYLRALAMRLADDGPVAYAAHETLTELLGKPASRDPAVVAAISSLEGVPQMVAALEARAQGHVDFAPVRCLSTLVGHAAAAEALARLAIAKNHDDAAEGLVAVGPHLSDATLARVIERIGVAPAAPPGLVRALGAYGARAAAAVPALVGFLEGRLERHQEAAATALRGIPHEDAAMRARLVAVVLEGTDTQARLAVDVLGAPNLPRDRVPALAEQLADPAKRTRALRALTMYGPDAVPALPALPPLLVRSAPWEQVMAVAKLIEAIGPRALPVLPALVDLLDTTHHFWALCAIGGIGPDARAGAEARILEVREAHAARRAQTRDIDRTLEKLRRAPS